MTTEEVIAEAEQRGEPFQAYDTPVVLSVYALYRTMLAKAHEFEAKLEAAQPEQQGDYWKGIALDLTRQNQALCEWNRRLSDELYKRNDAT